VELLLLHAISTADDARLDDSRVNAAQAQSLSLGRRDELQGIHAEARGEFPAAGMRQAGRFEHGAADRQLRAGRQVLLAQVEIDVELVARQRPEFPFACEQADQA
jgi:hypothetical protein